VDGTHHRGADCVMPRGGQTPPPTAIGTAPEPASPARGKRPGW